jgi:hypothetical protein
LPVLAIFLDTCHRLESIRGSIATLDPRAYENETEKGKLLEIKARSEKEMMPALRQVEALLPELDKTLKRLKEMDLIAWERRKILHMDGSFYPEAYYQLISDLKTSNVPLVKMDYLLHDLRFHGLLD